MDRQTAKYGALIWDGNIYHEIEDQSGQNYTFHEVDDLIIEDNFKKFEELLEHNPHLINSLRTKRNKTTLLMESAWSRTWAETFPKLAEYNQDISVVGIYDRNIIHRIVIHGADDEALTMLTTLSKHQNIKDPSIINAVDSVRQDTPLHMAAYFNKLKTLEYLVDFDADLTLRNNKGEKPGEHFKCSEDTKKLIKSLGK